VTIDIIKWCFKLSKKYFCPNCGSSTSPEDKFCLNCGKKLVKDSAPSPKVQKPQYEAPAQQQAPYVPPQPYAPTQTYAPTQPMPVSGGGIPKHAYAQLKASYCDRGLAYLIDGCIFSFCPPLACFRDIIPKAGKGFGKSAMNLMVVDYDTGLPITAGQACVRTLCMGATSGFDACVPLCTEDGRRLGDLVANTIVLEDRS